MATAEIEPPSGPLVVHTLMPASARLAHRKVVRRTNQMRGKRPTFQADLDRGSTLTTLPNNSASTAWSVREASASTNRRPINTRKDGDSTARLLIRYRF